MPRPKVKPQDRVRSVRACDACKISKKRCDGALPCILCSRKGLARTCAYTAPRRRRLLSPQSVPEREAMSVEVNLSPILTTSSGGNCPSIDVLMALDETPGQPQPSLQTDLRHSESMTTAVADGPGQHPVMHSNPRSQAPSTPAQKPVMLSCSTGEKVIIGTPAAISFLRFLQTTLKDCVGPSGFTDDPVSRRLFEVATPDDVDTASFDDDIPDEERGALIQCFLDVSSGFLDLFTPEEIARIVERPRAHGSQTPGRRIPPRGIERTDLASLYLMIAIGAQCRGELGSGADGITDSTRVRAGRYFSVARKIVFEGMLEDPTVHLVRIFLLMAFYMLGACRRNSAFMYIGVASKSADILGLHAAANVRHLPLVERETRLRVAKSLRVFDIICSSILGRQSSSLTLRSDGLQLPPGGPLSSNGSNSYSSLAVSAAYELSLILDDIVRFCTLADDGRLDDRTAETFFRTLRAWSQALPAELRQRPRNSRSKDASVDSDPNHRQVMIGNVHLAGMYYFSVILVTRPSLVQHVIPYLRGEQLPPRPGTMGFQSDQGESSKATELSQACIEAATYMIQMCRDAMEARILWGNMCILKAWIFAAGLVLGFPLLVDSGATIETIDAFHTSRHLLRDLGRLSPQAAQYQQILGAFSDAITSYRDHTKRERRKSRSLFVEPVLSFEGLSGEESGGGGGGGGRSGTATNAGGTQLPTPEFTACDDEPGEEEDVGHQRGDDPLAYLSDFLGVQGNQGPGMAPADDDLLLRLFWDGFTVDFMDPIPQGDQGEDGLG